MTPALLYACLPPGESAGIDGASLRYVPDNISSTAEQLGNQDPTGQAITSIFTINAAMPNMSRVAYT